MIQKIKKHIPEFAMNIYHKFRGIHAAILHGYPARKMIVIAVTGTKGKTSTANYIWSVLHSGGVKAGLITSANFRIGENEEPNVYHMTMPSPYIIQKKIAEMQKKNISVVVVEMTSEGMKQSRHSGIPIDIAVFTNLTPEHLGSHKGSFEVYKKAKSPMFQSFGSKYKTFFGKQIPKVILANADSEHAEYYLSFPADQKITFGLENGAVQALGPALEKKGSTFTTGGTRYELSIPGMFNIYNALPAIIVGNLLEIPISQIHEGLRSLAVIPGRMESIDEGQPFSVYVDYAHEPASLTALLTTARGLIEHENKVILLMGVIGGGRAPRAPMAKIAAELADFLIITNEDPYSSNPQKMIDELADVAEKNGKQRNETVFPITDRRAAITKALSLAGEGDIVLISGKGAETTMMTKEGAIPWNERSIVRQLTKEFSIK